MRQSIKQEATKVLVQANEFKGEEGGEANHRLMLISKMMNMKENLQKQVFEGSLYRKLVIWNDLSIQPDEYSHKKVVDCIKKINDYQEELSYMPTKLQF